MIQARAVLTDKERAEMEFAESEGIRNRAHLKEMKELELALEKQKYGISQFTIIPITIIKLPVYCLLALGFIVAQVAGRELPEDFWRFMTGR